MRDRAEALEAADRLKSDFVHHASFLFRDPLNAVHGFASCSRPAQAGRLTPKQDEYVNDILTASDTLADVTSDILDLALIDSGAMRLELATRRSQRAAVARRGNTYASTPKVSISNSGAIGVPILAEIVADGRRLRQVVFNLLSNAFKYTPRGGIDHPFGRNSWATTCRFALPIPGPGSRRR